MDGNSIITSCVRGKVARIGIKMMKVSIPDEIKIIRNEKDYKTSTEKIKMDTKKDEEELKKL